MHLKISFFVTFSTLYISGCNIINNICNPTTEMFSRLLSETKARTGAEEKASVNNLLVLNTVKVNADDSQQVSKVKTWNCVKVTVDVYECLYCMEL